MNTTDCADYCSRQAINNWSNATLGITEIVFTSLNIIINYFVYRRVGSNARVDNASRQRLFDLQ